MEWKPIYKQYQEVASRRYFQYLDAYFNNDETLAIELADKHRLTSPAEREYQEYASYYYFKTVFEQEVEHETDRKHRDFHLDLVQYQALFAAQASEICQYDNLFKQESETFQELENSISIRKPIVEFRSLSKSILGEDDHTEKYHLFIDSKRPLLEQSNRQINFCQYLANSVSETLENTCKSAHAALYRSATVCRSNSSIFICCVAHAGHYRLRLLLSIAMNSGK